MSTSQAADTPPIALDAWWETNLRLAEMAAMSGEPLYLRITMLGYDGTTTETLPVLMQDDHHGRERLRAVVKLAALAADALAMCSIGVGGKGVPPDRQKQTEAPLLIVEQIERGPDGVHSRVCIRPIFRDRANNVVGLGAVVSDPAYRYWLREMLAADRPSAATRDQAAHVLDMLTDVTPIERSRTRH